jgi:hypothetical protein
VADKDVLGKADALLRRHSANPGADTGTVPLLTDLVEVPAPRSPAEELAHEVFKRVMAEVEGRLAADLEHRVAQHIVSQVHAAVASALGDLRQELANAIGDAVNEALRNRPVK